jgi:hypothetical protein
MNAVPQRTFELLDATQEFASEQITEQPDAVPGLYLGKSIYSGASGVTELAQPCWTELSCLVNERSAIPGRT